MLLMKQVLVSCTGILTLWRIMWFFNIGSKEVLRKILRVMDEFVYKVIRNKIEQAQKLQDNLLVSTNTKIMNY